MNTTLKIFHKTINVINIHSIGIGLGVAPLIDK